MSHFAATLRDAGFRATPGRLALLELLEESGTPLSVKTISRRLSPRKDEVTVYRALEALSNAGILARVDFQHDHAHYELIADKKHHHHIVCNACGMVEDITECPLPTLTQKALNTSQKFTRITNHSFELFGICATCA